MTPDQINELIQQLLKTGEILATHAYSMALRQIYLKAILDAISIVLCAGAWFAARSTINAIYKSQDATKFSELEESAPSSCFSMFLYVLLWILPLIMLVNAYYVISYLFNPEWYAVQLLINTLLQK